MKKLLVILSGILCLSLLLVVSCRKDFKPDTNNTEESALNAPHPAIDPRSKPNPFDVRVVRKAVALLRQQAQSGAADAPVINPNEEYIPEDENPTDPIQPNYTYVRFLPGNLDQLTTLIDVLGLDLYDVPLHIEMDNEPEWYQDPALSPDAITWQYTVVPYGYELPADIPHETLGNLFLFNDDDGEPLEPEDDWGGERVEQLTPSTNPAYIPVRKYFEQKGNPMAKADATLRNAAKGISKAALYNKIMELTGNKDEIDEAGDDGNARARVRYQPKGHLTVKNSDYQVAPPDGLLGVEPLKGALVKSFNFFKIGHGYTDGNGDFTTNKKYKRKAKLIVKFKNDRCAIKGINGSMKLWQYAFPVRKKLGRYWRNELQTVSYAFYHDGNRTSRTTRSWAAATTLNSRWDMDKFNEANGLPYLPYLKIWMFSHKPSNKYNCAPMQNNMNTLGSSAADCIESNSGYNSVTGVFAGGFALIADNIGNDLSQNGLDWQASAITFALTIFFTKFKPDIITGYGADNNQPRKSYEIYNTNYKRLALVTLYQQVGASYWCEYAGKWNLFYAIGGQPAAREWIRIVEGYGQFIANEAVGRKYKSGPPATTPIGRDELKRIDNFITDESVTDGISVSDTTMRGWYNCGFLYDLTDDGESTALTGIADNVNAYTVATIFAAYKSDVKDKAALRQKLLSVNSNLQATQVNQLYTSYGY